MRAPVVILIAGAAGLVGFLAGREVAPARAERDERTVAAPPPAPRVEAPAPAEPLPEVKAFRPPPMATR